ncbi:MAG: isoprenoid biosynthesis glyoxalase ElbB [Planctomycetota bacterium]|nr:isoprenoid biosynthesis glyoxalase ElbB [Planctomycetota bacterium]
MGKKVGVILAGSGVNDGSEIHEAVCTMVALDRADAEIIFAAPDKDQRDVIDHQAGAPMEETRNVLVESARIARGNVRNLGSLEADELDAVILPGGFGAAKNLSSFAVDGKDCSVDPDLVRLLRNMNQAGKPIGALCIAPAIIAAVFGSDHKPEITIGADEGTASALEAMGAKHVSSSVSDIVIDEQNKIVTNACYMLATRISEVANGAEKVVKAVLEMA